MFLYGKVCGSKKDSLVELTLPTRITGQFFDPLKMADVIIMNGIKNVIEIK
jgi:hypothetical protein